MSWLRKHFRCNRQVFCEFLHTFSQLAKRPKLSSFSFVYLQILKFKMSEQREFTDEYLLRMLADVITHRMPTRDIDLLIRAGVRVNGVVKNGLRPLHYAVFQNNKDTVAHLCDNGALVNFCDEVGKSTYSCCSSGARLPKNANFL